MIDDFGMNGMIHKRMYENARHNNARLTTGIGNAEFVISDFCLS